MTNDTDFLQELDSQHQSQRFMSGLVTMVVLDPLHTLELKQKHISIESRDVVRFSNPGVLAVMWWA